MLFRYRIKMLIIPFDLNKLDLKISPVCISTQYGCARNTRGGREYSLKSLDPRTLWLGNAY